MARKFYENSDTIPVIKYEETTPPGFTLITDADQLSSLYNSLTTHLQDSGENCINEIHAHWYENWKDGTWTDSEYYDILGYTMGVLMFACMGMMEKAGEVNNGLTTPTGVYTSDVQSDINEHLDDHVLEDY